MTLKIFTTCLKLEKRTMYNKVVSLAYFLQKFLSQTENFTEEFLVCVIVKCPLLNSKKKKKNTVWNFCYGFKCFE